MPEDTMSPHEAMRTLGAFMEEHGPHGGKPDIEAERITLLCDAHSPPAYEIIALESAALRRAMGLELSEQRAVSF